MKRWLALLITVGATVPAFSAPPGPTLSERVAITDIVTGLLHSIDALDWKGVRDTLADRVETDYTSLFGGKPVIQPVDELVLAWQGLLPGFQATQHLLGPIVVRREGARVAAETHVRAYHYLGEPGGEVWMVAGHYRFQLARGARGGWGIDAISLTTLHQEGSLKLVDVARERAKTSPRRR